MAFNGNILLPGIIVHSADFWPLHPVAGPSLNLFMRAIEAGLGQVRELAPAAITAMFRNPASGWRASGDQENGRVTIRDGRGRFSVRDLIILDPPAGWWDTAEIAERLLLLVTDVPLPSVAGRDFGPDLAGIAADGRLCGAGIDFGAEDVPVPPLPQDDTVHILVDPVGTLVSLVDNVRAHIISLAEARVRLRSLSGLLSHELVAAGLPEEELARRLIGTGVRPGEQVGLDHAIARLVTEFAEMRDPSRASRFWRGSADRAVATGVRALAGGHDPTIFADVAELSGCRLAQLRDPVKSRDKLELARALQGAVSLRLAALGPEYAGGDDYASDDGLLNCVTAGVIRATGTGQAGLPPEASELLEQAWELLHELALLDPDDDAVRTRALTCLLQYELRRAPQARNPELFVEVLEELSGRVDGGAEPVLAMLLARLRYQADPAGGIALIGRLLAEPAAEFRARHGDLIARQVCTQAILAARAARSRPLLVRALAWSDLLPSTAGADARQVLEARGHCLADDPTPCPGPAVELCDLAVEYRMGHPEWADGQRAAAMLHLAAHARAAIDPTLGLALLDQVDVRFKLSEDALLLSADLHLQLALHGGEAEIGRAGGAMMAAGGYAGLGMLELSAASLILLIPRLNDADEEERQMAISSAVTALPQLRSSRDPVLSRLAHELAHRAMVRALTDEAPLTVQVAMHRAAKGADFAVARLERDAFTLPASIGRLRAEWQLLSKARAAGLFDSPGRQSGDISLDVVAYDDYAESAEGSDPAQIEENQRRHLDHLFTSALLESRYGGDFTIEMARNIQLRLDERTVLLSYFAPDPEITRRDFLILLAITREEATGAAIISDRAPAPDDAGAGRPRRHVLSDEVEEVLTAVAGPSFGVMDPHTAGLLGRADRIFGDPAMLRRWRAAGKDHLCIWPHGPLHYLPFHLYTVDSEPVAAHWTVTTIPGLESLSGGQPSPDRSSSPASTTRRAVVVGYGGSAEPSLADVDKELRRHALEVAALTGAAALVGGDATRSRLLAEIGHADVIHIAAHGGHDPAAPWFDFIQLHPDQADDGRVLACDLLAADLSAVRLVTLATCDSALGRFDLNDNLRGIPAGFLLAGARAVVGCLWQVRPEPTTMFFSDLHIALAEGTEPLAAFRAAQLTARERFPDYRDWGAFCYRAGR